MKILCITLALTIAATVATCKKVAPKDRYYPEEKELVGQWCGLSVTDNSFFELTIHADFHGQIVLIDTQMIGGRRFFSIESIQVKGLSICITVRDNENHKTTSSKINGRWDFGYIYLNTGVLRSGSSATFRPLKDLDSFVKKEHGTTRANQ